MGKATGACRDCKNCTNSSFANFGRKLGRGTAGLMTVGISEVGMATQKKCRLCGHQMSLHGVDQVGGAPQPTVNVHGMPAVAPAATPMGQAKSFMSRMMDQAEQLAEQKKAERAGQPAAARPAPAEPAVAPAAAPAEPVAAPAAAPVPPPPGVPAGWYPDPNGAALQRYWDGGAWTDHTAPAVPR